jgi:hypothetical protein
MIPLYFNSAIKGENMDRYLQHFKTFILNLRFEFVKSCLMVVFIGLYSGEL